ncbi:plasmid segregation protein ParM domain-containing protein [Bacillus sp. FJAT-47783]|uniref:ParM/StbA family protein n=1 Tax=Bacillus sp. FJAT-47783 TaxID=2922712 RepID=UPI001FAB9C64|nr:plasmid segregation protein ParM domain-containing protein [Bacillus sp. FJAT-47783]
MIIFGLDLGNKQTKLYSDKTVEGKVLPSHFLYYDDLGDAQTSIFGSKLNISKYKVPFDEEEYAWGIDLHKVHNNDKLIDTISFENRYDTDEFKLLANFALGELAKDYKDTATKSILEVSVVTGVPSDDFNENSVRSIIKVLNGDHTITIDDTSYIVRVAEVQVIPQSIGTVYNELLDKDGYIVEEKESYLEEEITVVDIGGGTILVDTLKNMNLSSKTQFPTGIYSLYDMIVESAKEKAHGITSYDVEQILRDGTDEEGYFYKPNKHVSHDITNNVKRARSKYTRDLINKISKTIKSTNSIDTMLFTGGGANLIDKEKVLQRYNRAVFVENSEVANVTGFFKYGKGVMLEVAASSEE